MASSDRIWFRFFRALAAVTFTLFVGLLATFSQLPQFGVGITAFENPYSLIILFLLSLLLGLTVAVILYRADISETQLGSILHYVQQGKQSSTQPPHATDIQETTGGQVMPRRSLPPLEDFLREATSEVHLIGLSQEEVPMHYGQTVRELIQKRNVSITFLILNPESDIIKKLDEAVPESIKVGIMASLQRLCKISEGLMAEHKGKLDIRTYDLLPVHSMIIIDPDEPNGKMRVETYLYKADPNLRINVIVDKKNSPEIFHQYWSSYKFALQTSKQHRCE